jgi:triosephosphate isomerase
MRRLSTCGGHFCPALNAGYPPGKRPIAGTGVSVGAQNLFWEDRGAFTGEVSGVMLRELGCRYVEVGHAERRPLFGESNEVVALKVAAALRNSLSPGDLCRRAAAQ